MSALTQLCCHGTLFSVAKVNHAATEHAVEVVATVATARPTAVQDAFPIAVL